MTSWSYVWGTTRAAKRETRASRRPSQFLWRPCRGGSSANRERKLQQTLPNRVFQQRVRGSGTEMWGRLASRRADHGQPGSWQAILAQFRIADDSSRIVDLPRVVDR